MKPQNRVDAIEVLYNREHWRVLSQLRQKAQRVISTLQARHIYAIVHGSVARGDVNKNSDVDIFLPNPPSSFQIETALEQAKIPVVNREVIQATPAYAMKAYIELDDTTTISFPLMELRRVERQFYRFSGEINLYKLEKKKRVSGVDKRLLLIEPTEKGHVENSIVGAEEQIAKILGVAVETVLDRVHVLKRRDVAGRTGVFLKQTLGSDETFELAMKRLMDENAAVRRRLKSIF